MIASKTARGNVSGHSKWSTIKRKKGAADAKRGQLFTKLAREITVAARDGLPDPDSNPRLRLAIAKARSESMPKDNIDRAIERGSGDASGDQYDEIYYEGYGPGGTAIMVLAMTDNRNRTVGELRAALTRAGGTLGESGSVGWMFDQMGVIAITADEEAADDIQLLAIDAGAQDVAIDSGIIEVYTAPQDLHKVQESLAASGFEAETAELTMRAKTLMAPERDVAIKALRLLEKLDDLDDVQQVYSNLDVPEDVLAEVG